MGEGGAAGSSVRRISTLFMPSCAAANAVARAWFEGEDSGHVQQVHEIRLDCDGDVVLLKVTQLGHAPGIACHTGRHSCFFQRLEGGQWRTVEPVLKDPEAIYR